MKIRGADKSELMQVSKIERQGNDLLRQIDSHAICLLGLIEGERHTEVFVTCAC